MSDRIKPIPKSTIDKIRNHFEERLSDLFEGEERVCVLLSGGIDSTFMGLVSHHVGKKIVSVSYQLEGIYDEGCQRAENTSSVMGWDFNRVVIQKDRIEDWFFHLIFEQNCRKKTEVEILFPFIHLIDRVKKLGFSKVITGFGAPLPDGRNDTIEARTDWFGYLDRMVESSSTHKCIDYGKSVGVEVISPFYEKDVIELCKLVSLDQCHHPFQKYLWKKVYEDDIQKIGMMKTINQSLQKSEGLQSLFPKLLSNRQINKPNYSKGSNVVKLGSLIRYWSKKTKKDIPKSIDLNPQIVEGKSPPVRKFKTYTLTDVKRESDKELFTVVTTFSGGGGSSTGYKLGGGKILLMNEFIPEGVNTYLHNYPNTPYEMVDIRKITRRGGRDYVVKFFKERGIEVGGFDLLDGSPPCSTFSTSGKGQKKNEEKNVKYSDTTQDRIGMLIHDFVYINNCMKPKVCVIENVPSIKSSDVFQHSLERLRRWGYKVNFSIMKSSHFGVPQKRRRLIVIGIRPDICKHIGLKNEEEILDLYPSPSVYEPTLKDGLDGVEIDEFERKQLLLSQIQSSSYELVKVLPKDPPTSMGMSNIDPNWTSDFNLVRSSWNEPVNTITQMGAQLGRGSIVHPSEDRSFTINELKRVMGLPEDYILTGTFNQRAERCGRMVTPPIYKHLSQSLYENVFKHTKDVVWDGEI